MSDSRQITNVSKVKADTVIINPVQQIFGAAAEATRGWTEALLRGPLEESAQVQRAAEGDEDAIAERHLDAAEAFIAVAAALTAKGYGPAATTYRHRAADAFAAADRRTEAFEIFMSLARDALGDGEMTSLFHARRAFQLAPAELAWSARGMQARANWPEVEEGDPEALRRAWEETRDGPEEAEWGEPLVESLLFRGEHDVCAAVAADICDRLPLADGPRLEIELVLAELEEADAHKAGEERWAKLLAWARSPTLPPETTARVLQRRGVGLTRRGEAAEARSVFLQATATWSRRPNYDDQASEAFFSAGSSGLALGDISPAFDDARHLARHMRGTAETSTSRTERLERRGLRALVDGRMPDALRLLATAHNIARRAGNLSDFFQVTEEFGDVLAASDRPANALAAYVQSGQGQKAAAIGGRMGVDDVLGIVALDGPHWERTAAWAAVAKAGRLCSDEGAATVASAALAELEREQPTGFPPNPSYYAGQALANVICAVPDDMLERSLAALRTRLKVNGGDPRRLAEPFELITATGRADETEIVVDAILHPYLQSKPPIGLLDEAFESRPDQRERILAAARSGDRQALEFATFADWLDGEDTELTAQACAEVTAATTSSPREVTEEDGTTTVAYGIGVSLAPVGLMAQSCPEPERRALAAHLLEVLLDPDPQLPVMTRVAVVHGIHNLAPALPNDLVPPIVEALATRSTREEEVSDFDRIGVDDPLARFNVNLAPPHALRTSALEALAVVVANNDVDIEHLDAPIAAALQSGVDLLISSALAALRVIPPGQGSEPDLGELVAHPSDQVRIAAIDLLLRREPETFAGHIYRLVNDPSPQVRMRMIGAAAEVEDGAALLGRLSHDRDAYVRAMARARRSD
jgi:HEAT repeats